jgi:hypothetical protein
MCPRLLGSPISPLLTGISEQSGVFLEYRDPGRRGPFDLAFRKTPLTFIRVPFWSVARVFILTRPLRCATPERPTLTRAALPGRRDVHGLIRAP